MGTLGGHLLQGRQGLRPSDEENVPGGHKISVSLNELFLSQISVAILRCSAN